MELIDADVFDSVWSHLISQVQFNELPTLEVFGETIRGNVLLQPVISYGCSFRRTLVSIRPYLFLGALLAAVVIAVRVRARFVASRQRFVSDMVTKVFSTLQEVKEEYQRTGRGDAWMTVDNLRDHLADESGRSAAVMAPVWGQVSARVRCDTRVQERERVVHGVSQPTWEWTVQLLSPRTLRRNQRSSHSAQQQQQQAPLLSQSQPRYTQHDSGRAGGAHSETNGWSQTASRTQRQQYTSNTVNYPEF